MPPGPEHKALRKSFLSLFTRRALGVYVEKQDQIVREHLRMWVEKSKGQPMEFRPFVRDLTQFTSEEVFSGGCKQGHFMGSEWGWGPADHLVVNPCHPFGLILLIRP